jgi:hypothetical protein
MIPALIQARNKEALFKTDSFKPLTELQIE